MTAEQQVSKTVQGRVISHTMDKTIIVEITSKIKHPLYGKYVKHHSTMCAHDAENKSKTGDMVEIKQSRPLSRTKNWVLVRVLETAI